MKLDGFGKGYTDTFTIGQTVYLPNGWNQDNQENPYIPARLVDIQGPEGSFAKVDINGKVETVAKSCLWHIPKKLVYCLQYPAKIYQSDSLPVRIEGQFSMEGFSFFYIAGKRVYWDSKKSRLAWSEAGESVQVWVVLEELYAFPISTYHDLDSFGAAFRQSMKEGAAQEIFSRALENIKNPEAYAIRANVGARAEELAKIRADREAQIKEQEARDIKRKEEAEKVYRQLLEAAKDDFLQGRLIGWEYFEALCRENGVDIHMRTLGMARKKCAEIGLSSARIVGGKAGQLFVYARALDEKLRA